MKAMHLLTLICCLTFAAACGGDTAGAASNSRSNDDTPDIGDGTPDMGEPDDGNDQPGDMAGDVSCERNDDCVAPEVCIIDETTGVGTCGAPTGAGETGDACTTGDECASGLCINGLCAEPCEDDVDCPNGFVCELTDISADVSINVCVPEVVPCSSNTDCVEPDVCVVDRGGDDVTLECGAPVGGGALGDACTEDADCASNLCLDDLCSAPCETSSDCADDGSFVCEAETVATGGGTEGLTVCKPRPPEICLSDAECSGGDRCVASKTATELEFRCDAPNAGGAESGESCTDDVDCAQNLCVDGACAGPCETVGDCGGSPMRCEVSMVDLGAGNTDSAQICLLPVECDANDACRTARGEVCYVRELQASVDAFCRSPNVGGGTLGQRCTSEQVCANNFCLDTRFRDVCSVPCADDADCGVAGYECGTVTFDLAAGGTEDLDVCVPESPPACTSNDDCETGLRCVIIENESADALESVCVPTTGGDATGVPCNEDDDCASLVCLNSFCAAPCDDSTQCGQGQLCQTNTVEKNGTSGDFDVCETLPDTQCTSSDDCADGVRVCGQIRDNMGTQEGYCTFPNSGGDQLGTACTASDDCRENICLLGISDECSVICDSNDDCAATQECTTFGDLNFCNTACSDNSDCGAPDRYCGINGDVITDDVDQICRNPVGTGELGEPCSTGGDCLTGVCLSSFTFTGPDCTMDSDCASDQVCTCPVDDPGCSTEQCADVEHHCTNLCDDAQDCVGDASNELTSCSTDIYVSRPSGTSSVQVAACAKP